MSRRCAHQLINTKSARAICRNISTSSSHFTDKQDKNEEAASNKEDDEKPKIGFFARVKEEFMNDLKNNEENKKSLESLQKQKESLRTQYDKYVGTNYDKYIGTHYDKYVAPKMASFKSPKTEEEEEASTSAPDAQPVEEKISFRDRISTLKSRLSDKEQLAEDYSNMLQTAKEKSELSINRLKNWREKPDSKAPEETTIADEELMKTEAEHSKEEETSVKEKKPSVMRQKIGEMYDKSGLAENPYYQKIVQQTSSVIDENKGKFSGISIAAAEAIKQSQDFRESVREKSKLVSKQLNKQVGASVGDLEKKLHETKEMLEKSGVREMGKEALDKSREALDKGKEAFDKSEKIARETAERVGYCLMFN